MVSPTAMADIKAAISSGVVFTPEEIIRLNALGLRYDYSKNGAELRIMPRVAWLGDVALREPTIGHEIWMQQASDVFNLDNAETRIKVRAFCLANEQSQLPPMTVGAKELKRRVEDFCGQSIAPYTLGQVACALMFAEYGDVQTAMEIPEDKPISRKQKHKPIKEGEYCYEVGLVRNGVLMNLGTPDELMEMSVAGLELLIEESMKMDSRFGVNYAKDVVSSAFGDYKRTLNSILQRHRNNGDEQDRA